MRTSRFVPTAAGLRAIAEANPGITVKEMATKLRCNASHLSSELQRYGIELTHGRRKETTTDKHTLSFRKIPPARGKSHRQCLTCGEGFMSEGPGNRMCSDCRRTKSD
jgi:hypothetical protein